MTEDFTHVFELNNTPVAYLDKYTIVPKAKFINKNKKVMLEVSIGLWVLPGNHIVDTAYLRKIAAKYNYQLKIENKPIILRDSVK